MKLKLMGILIAAFLVLGVTAPGHAGYFVQGDLYRVAYYYTVNPSTGAITGIEEEGTDLGSLSTILATSGAQTLGSGSLAVNLSDLGASSWSQVNVAYFAYTTTGNAQQPGSTVAVSSTGSTATNIAAAFTAFNTNANLIQNYYLGNPPGNTTAKSVASAGGGTNSYFQLMDATANDFPPTDGNLVGSFNWLTTYNGEVTANANTPQASNLFQWVGSTISSGGRNPVTGLNDPQPGTLVAGFETEVTSNGLVTVLDSDVATAPVPPSVLLLAPGLLGLVGLRKKMWR